MGGPVPVGGGPGVASRRRQRPRAVILLAVALLAVSAAPPPAAADPFEGRFEGYEVEPAEASLVALDDATAVELSDDEVTNASDLGFSTEFFAVKTNLFWVGSNGFISLHEKEEPGCCEGQPLPTDEDPNGLIAGFWTDLDPGSGGAIRFQRFDELELSGLSPQAGLVVEYDAVPGPGGGTNTFQILLLVDGVFEVRVASASVPAGTNASVGAENFAGRLGVEVHHADDLTLEGAAWRFTPIYVPLVPDLVVEAVEVVRPQDPTARWTIRATVANRGEGPIERARINATVTPTDGPLRGTSDGCTEFVGTTPVLGMEPESDPIQVTFFWRAPVDPDAPGPPQLGEYRFNVTGVVVRSAEPEQNVTNNRAENASAYLVEGQGGLDPLCQELPAGVGPGAPRPAAGRVEALPASPVHPLLPELPGPSSDPAPTSITPTGIPLPEEVRR